MQPSSRSQPAGWPPAGTGSHARPPYEAAPPAPSPARARPWLIALAAAATMLVLIAAIGNPPVTRSLLDNPDFNSFAGRLRLSLASFSWHLSDLGNDFGHLYLGNLVMDVVLVVLVVLLVAVVSSGSGSFGRTFLATWIAVIAAGVFAGYVRAAVVDETVIDPNRLGKPAGIFFSVSSPGSSLIFVAVAFGLVAALVAAAVGVITRRREVPAAPEPYPPAAYLPGHADRPAPGEQPAAQREPWSAPPAAAPRPGADASPRPTEAPAAGADDDGGRTTQVPAVDPRAVGGSEPSDHTRQLPRTEREV